MSLRYALVVSCLALLPCAALAQALNNNDIEDVINVRNRMNADFMPLNVRLGAFLFAPAIELSETWDDNIFRAATKTGDFITRVQPSASLRSDWNLHEIRFEASGDFGIHADHADENYQDYAAAASGRLDIRRETYVDALLRHEMLHEDRASPDDAGGDEPTEFSRTTARLGFTRALARLKLYLIGQRQNYAFENASAGGAVIDNGARNRDQYLLRARLAYELSPRYEAFIGAAGNIRDYESSGAADRSSKGYELRAGTALNLGGKAKGEIYAGYIAQDYKNFEDVGNVNYGGSLLWNPTGLTSVHAGLERSVVETISGGSSGYARTAGLVGVDHALRRWMLLGAYLGLDLDEFNGGLNREDETFRAGLNAEYRPRRGASVVFRYDFTDRDSSAVSDYADNAATISLKFAL